jgi:two-component system response regulator FixJ
MTQVRQKHVIFVGTSTSVREALNEIATQRGVPMRALDSVQDWRKPLAEAKITLLVLELDGDAAEQLQHLTEVRQQHPQIPVLAIVENGDIPTAVQAIRRGAANCLERPVDPGPLTSALDELLDQMGTQSQRPATPLTSIEMTILQYVLQGRTNRQIAEALHRSPRTVEVHRSHIMRKLGVSTVIDLVKTAVCRGLARDI